MAARIQDPRRQDLAQAGEVTVAADAQFLTGPADPYLDRLADAAARASDAELWVALDGADAVLGTMTWCPPGSPWRELAADDEGEFRMLSSLPLMAAARRLYERLGFEPAPDRDWAPVPGFDLIAFRKELR